MIGRCLPSCWPCGLRRHELAELSFGHLQQREGHWAIVDLSGKAGHVRAVPVPDWVYRPGGRLDKGGRNWVGPAFPPRE